MQTFAAGRALLTGERPQT